MRKTTVYLTDEDAEQLRLLSAETGRSQSELIREGIARLAGRRRGRAFHSLGKGEGDGTHPTGWTTDALYRKVSGRR